MIVNINNSTYEMNSKQYKAVLDTASKEYKSKEELKQAVENYTEKGFKVHWK